MANLVTWKEILVILKEILATAQVIQKNLGQLREKNSFLRITM